MKSPITGTLETPTLLNDDALGYAQQFSASDGTPLGQITAGAEPSTVAALSFSPSNTTLSGQGVNLSATESGTSVVQAGGNQAIQVTAAATVLAQAYAQTTDPHKAGALWNNAGIPTFSNG